MTDEEYQLALDKIEEEAELWASEVDGPNSPDFYYLVEQRFNELCEERGL